MNSERQKARDGDRQAGLSVPAALYRYMEQAPLPFAITRGAKHTLVYANAAFCSVAGVADERALGSPIIDVLRETARSTLAASLDRAFHGKAERVEMRLGGEGAAKRSWSCDVWPVIGSDALPEGLGIELRQTERPDNALELQRQVAEQMLLGALREQGLAEDAEEARRRAAFLAEAGRLLAESADRASTLVVLTMLALPTLGSWCIVDLVESGNAVQRLGIFHPYPEKQKLAHELTASWAPEADDPFGAFAMLRDTRTIAITENIEETLAATAHGNANLEVLRQLGIGSLLTVALEARGKLLGAITFVTAERGHSYRPEDIRLAEELARRGALALERAQLYDSAVVLRQTAETANIAKADFLGAMSHELRTPLNAIGGYVELIDMGLRGPVTQEQHADLGRIKASQQYLLVLIRQILNYTRAESGHLSYTLTNVDAREVLARSVELVEPLMAPKGLVLERVECEPGIIASADPEKAVQIVVNLLSNAIKFTPEGGTISVSCDAADDVVHLCISDTGMGIPAEKLESIFDPFIQLASGFTGRGSGIGLGLAISRDLARAMHGDVSVESTEGKGSRFTVSLPAAAKTP